MAVRFGNVPGIVVDDSDPAQPVVRYLDAEWKEGEPKHLSQKDEKLKPDSFVVLKSEMEPGTSIAIQDGADLRHGQVIRVAGDKVYAALFAGKSNVFPKSQVKGVPVKPNLKEGDQVMAEWVGKLVPATVTRVDPNVGRVWVKYDSAGGEKAVA